MPRPPPAKLRRGVQRVEVVDQDHRRIDHLLHGADRGLNPKPQALHPVNPPKSEARTSGLGRPPRVSHRNVDEPFCNPFAVYFLGCFRPQPFGFMSSNLLFYSQPFGVYVLNPLGVYVWLTVGVGFLGFGELGFRVDTPCAMPCYPQAWPWIARYVPKRIKTNQGSPHMRLSRGLMLYWHLNLFSLKYFRHIPWHHGVFT